MAPGRLGALLHRRGRRDDDHERALPPLPLVGAAPSGVQRADHSTIFLAITGTYLAIAGLSMHGTIRVVLMVIIGAGAAVGITVRQFAIDAPKWANTLPYLVVSWAAAAVMPQIYRGGGPRCFALIIAGGAAYTIGAVFYGTKRPRLSPRVFGYHELFHAFTLIGAGLHFAAISVALR